MGQVVIEVPQEVNRIYRVDDVETSERILRDLETLTQKSKKESAILPPRRDNLKTDGEAVLGIWADREESGEEIARKIRENNRKVT